MSYCLEMILFAFIFLKLLTLVFGKQNVLFIISDDLRTNLGAYGYKNAFTPNIDKLASESFVFHNAFCQQALCAPSRNSFLTSRRPDTLHLYDFDNYWRENVGNFTTLPQYFKENGYFSHSIGKVFHPGISSNHSDDMPYSWSDEPVHPASQNYENSRVCINKDGTLGKNLLCPVVVNELFNSTLPDIETAEAALNFLKYHKNINGNRPFFLAVGFHKPHVPLKFPVEYLEFHPLNKIDLPKNRWRSFSLPNVAWNPWIDIRKREDVKQLNISFPFGEMPDEFMRKIIQHYNAAVTYIDDLIGGILRAVEGSNTIIVVTSDHGWSMGEHGEFAKYSNFDISTRVPLLIHVPNLSTSKISIENSAELVDLFPTLVDLTQVGEPISTCRRTSERLCTEGKSLVPLMIQMKRKRSVPNDKNVFSQYPRPGEFPTKFPNSDEPKIKDIKIMGYSIRTRRYRYTEWVEFNKTNFEPNWSRIYGTELYDHNIDSGENMNVIDRKELSCIAEDLRKKLISGWKHA